MCRMHTIMNEGHLQGFQELVTLAYNHREGHNEMAELAVWTVIMANQGVFDSIWPGSGFPPPMALAVMKILKSNYETSQSV